MDKGTALRYAEAYAAEVKKLYAPESVYMYGSYAKGTHHADSDIDIAVIFKKFNGDYLRTSQELYKLRRNICIDIEPIIVDDDDDITGFLSEIKNTGVLIV